MSMPAPTNGLKRVDARNSDYAMTFDEIAEILGITPNAAAVAYKKAMVKLARQWRLQRMQEIDALAKSKEGQR